MVPSISLDYAWHVTGSMRRAIRITQGVQAMRIMDATALSGLAGKTVESTAALASVIHNLIMDVRDSYRPELHYMRGPGPKWRAKHQPSPVAVPQPVAPTGQRQLLPLYARRRDAANSIR
jgi:hypothetical protein